MNIQFLRMTLSARVCVSFFSVFSCLLVFNLFESSGIVQEEKKTTNNSKTANQDSQTQVKPKSGQDKFTEEQIKFFETKVRPLLVEHCFDCHGPDTDSPEGGLSLASREAILEGGDSGAAIDLTEPESSHIIDAVNYADLFEMPPDSKLPQKEIDIITKWVKMGAPWTKPKPQKQEEEKFSEKQIEFFETKVRPLLVEHCFDCHGPDSEPPEGGLSLASREAILEGGDSGAAIDLTEPDKSHIIDAVNYADLFEMPPDSKLPQKEIDVITKWVKMGAPWPKSKTNKKNRGSKPEAFNIEKRVEQHWCWHPFVKPDVPKTKSSTWARDDIDKFILSKLENAGLAPSKAADRRTWIRRVYFDIVGLPPSVDEVEKFVADRSADAFEKVVDRLLDSPHFGERWARHWMDLTRFAETHGHEFDYPIAHAFEYRDYLIRAFNQNVPYDQFIREHIAGDLLRHPRENPDERFNESIIGTGFWFLGEATHGPVDSRGDEAGRIDNQIDVMSKSFLGLTVACARCHDHKFDAISDEDYYALSGFLQSSRKQLAMLDPSHKIANAKRAAIDLSDGAHLVLNELTAAEIDKNEFSNYLLASIEFIRGNAYEGEQKIVFAEGESMPVVKRSGGDSSVQEFQPRKNLKWRGNKQIWWFNGKVGDNLILEFSVPSDGKYKISGMFTRAVDYGIVDVAVNDFNPKRFDFFSSDLRTSGELDLGTHTLKRGKQQLAVSLVGTNPKAVKKFMFGLDYLKIEKIGNSSEGDAHPLSVKSLSQKYSLNAAILKNWIELLVSDTVNSVEHPLFLLQQIAKSKGPIDAAFFERIKTDLETLQQQSEQSLKDSVLFEDFDNELSGWFRSGEAFDETPVWDPSQIDLFSKGERYHVAQPGTLNSGRMGGRFFGVMRSPTFEITHKHVHYRMMADKVKIRLVVDGFFMDVHNSLLYNGLTFDYSSEGKYRWRLQGNDLKNHIGKRAYIEIIDHGFGAVSIDEIRFSNGPSPKDAPNKFAIELLNSQKFDSMDSFCKSFANKSLNTFKGEPDILDYKKVQSTLKSLLVSGKYFETSLPASTHANSTTLEESLERFDSFVEKIKKINSNTPRPRFTIAIADGTGEDEYVFVRGNHKNLGKSVPRRTLAALGGDSWKALTAEDGSGRLKLANKIASGQNPLAARVAVNRVWHHVFGRGIVASVDNFGVLGQAPTHPKLLDYLAAEFVDDSWNVKNLIRRLVLSATYRQSSKFENSDLSDLATAKDPNNDLLSRFRIRRLQGEAIRDSLLAVSGELDRKMFGPSVRVHLTPFMQGRGRPGSGPLDGARRRSIYTEVRRNFLSPMMLAFDTPVPFNTIGRRTTSNVPAQALILLNDPFVILQAEKWANRLLKNEASTDERIDLVYQIAFARHATETELQMSRQFLESQAVEHGVPISDLNNDARVWKDFCHVVFNVKEFIFIN